MFWFFFSLYSFSEGTTNHSWDCPEYPEYQHSSLVICKKNVQSLKDYKFERIASLLLLV